MTVMPRQERRAGVLETPLGTDVLAIARFDGSEGINELFEWQIEAVSARGDIDFDDLIGKHATLTISGVNGRKRKFDGIVTQTQSLGTREHFHAYRLVLRPWLWVLSHRTDSFIFHEKTVTDIIAEVFADYGDLADFDDRTNAGYKPIEYCVQYRESDMAFVCRLMEEFGISYSFVHSDGAHKLVLTDQNSQYETVEGGSRRYIELAGQDRRTEECLHRFIPGRRFASGKATWKDYNFKKPTAQMLAEKEGAATYEHAGKELYDWPGRYMELGLGQMFAQVKLEAHEALDRRCLGGGNSPSLYAGSLMRLEDHPQSALDGEYLVLRCQHTFTAQSYRSGRGAGGEDSYEGSYEFLDSAIPLRPMKVTPKSVVQGPQTALVVGKQGEEIDCDEYGRILVRFHWDRENDQSMRCRVAQNWAYKQWGGMIIPRIGMEVMVEFLDGDPDRPLVTGSVYNAHAMPPYALPEHKTKSVFRTNTHQSKRWEEMNELSFEDKEKNEEIFMHAQKDMSVHIEHNETKVVENNAYLRQRNNLMNETGNNRADLIHGDYNISVGIEYLSAGSRKRHELLNDLRPLANVMGEFGKVPQGVGNWNISVDNNKSESVQNTSTEMVGGTKALNTGNDLEVMVGRNHNMDVNGSSLEEVNEVKRLVVGEKFEIICGMSRIALDKDGNILITGKNTSIIVSDEVVVNGRKISLN